MRHTILKGQVEGNRLSVKAGAVRASGLRERERRRAEIAENDSTSPTLTKLRSHRAISEAGKVRGRKTRKTRSRKERGEKQKEENEEQKE